MTFNEEIYTALSTEATITALVNVNDIVFGHLPDNHKAGTDAIVYESNIISSQNTMPIDNYGDDYNLTIKAASQTPLNIYTIGQAVKDFLNTYSSTNFRQIVFERDIYVWNEDDDLHVLSLDFTIDYCN